MNAATLAQAMDCSPALADTYLDGCNAAMSAAACTTVNRAAMWLAQIGTESGGLKWSSELASGSEYEGRTDLGNIHPGDGPRYKGRGFIQITGRSNYNALSTWAYARHLTPNGTFFVDNPTALATPQYVWLGCVWYWTVARQLNPPADDADVRTCTHLINGGLTDLADRESRFNRARDLGSLILPTAATATTAATVTTTITTPPAPTPEDTDLYVLACQQNGHADYVVTGEKASPLNAAELSGYEAAKIPVYILPLANYQQLCGLLGVKA